MNLAEALSSSDAVLFIGSGASAWSGLPSWTKMLVDLADYLDHHSLGSELVRAEVAYGDLLQAASYGFDKLTSPQQGEFVRRACRYGIAQPSPLHQLLVSIGPRCFITTNYDNLLEEALRLWKPNVFFRPPVTNRDLIAMPEIIQARATDFIFKPHGDANDSQSIVLTREQYRMLLPGGERQATLESLKLLLVSRPVIFVGFGLRDPDFLFLKDVLLNIYKGGTRDHFALMADVSTEQVDYWRRSYGIHLISYKTSLKADGSRDHGELLKTLEVSVKTNPQSGPRNMLEATAPETILALARYASGLSQIRTSVPEFRISVDRKRPSKRNEYASLKSFAGASIETLLDRFDDTIFLIGLPGAGKSYALRKSVARQAEALHIACLKENVVAEDLVVPIFVDLKLYQENIERLIADSLPVGLSFRVLLKTFRVRLYLDSFNEVPRKFVESGEFEGDLRELIKIIDSSAMVIGSRTLDGLEDLGFDAYELDAIEEASVVDELSKRGFVLNGRFQPEMLELLQRPFYFWYVLNGEVSISGEPHPREFYQLLLAKLGQTLAARLHLSLDLENILRPVAYRALNSGEEAFPLTNLLRTIQASLGNTGSTVNASDIANGLVSCSLLVPYSGGRVAFVHQSITEYLASIELAARFAEAPELLREKLGLRRWDQALFLTVSHLQPPLDQQFFHGVLDIDLGLAVASAKFMEQNREKLVDDLLDEIIRRRDSIDEFNYELHRAMERGFPVNSRHLPKLREIVISAHPLRGPAARCAIEISGGAVKKEFLKFFVEFQGDYNLCANAIAPSLAPYATDDDLVVLAQWAREMETSLKNEYLEDDFHGFISGVAVFASGLSLATVKRLFYPMPSENLLEAPIRIAVLREIVRKNYSTEGLQCACDLLNLGDEKSCVTIHFILRFAKPENQVDTDFLNESHVKSILKFYGGGASEDGGWAWDAIDSICQCRPDLRSVVSSLAEDWSGLDRAGLLMCARQDGTPAFDALELLLHATEQELRNAAHSHIEHWELNWQGRESLFLDLMRLKNAALCNGLLGPGTPSELKGFRRVEISDVKWWLEWLNECLLTDDHWLVLKISSFLSNYAVESLARRLVSDFNDSTSRHRALLLRFVLPEFGSISTDDLSSEASAFAIDHLLKHGVDRWSGGFLGIAATEYFATEKLVPLLSRVAVNEIPRVKAVLEKAGQRHGRRYF
ncbi:SIR2 family protein [Variovorax robiniae]|uniref:SIR2 family protein n=1 Tax=Variovorax robiniae TaxID=1836199 RepID=A0ABU8XFA3_9BURK